MSAQTVLHRHKGQVTPEGLTAGGKVFLVDGAGSTGRATSNSASYGEADCCMLSWLHVLNLPSSASSPVCLLVCMT